MSALVRIGTVNKDGTIQGEEVDPKSLSRREYQRNIIGGPAYFKPGRPVGSYSSKDPLVTSLYRNLRVKRALTFFGAYHDQQIEKRNKSIAMVGNAPPEEIEALKYLDDKETMLYKQLLTEIQEEMNASNDGNEIKETLKGSDDAFTKVVKKKIAENEEDYNKAMKKLKEGINHE